MGRRPTAPEAAGHKKTAVLLCNRGTPTQRAFMMRMLFYRLLMFWTRLGRDAPQSARAPSDIYPLF
jgi:hypothetical protein